MKKFNRTQQSESGLRGEIWNFNKQMPWGGGRAEKFLYKIKQKPQDGERIEAKLTKKNEL